MRAITPQGSVDADEFRRRTKEARRAIEAMGISPGHRVAHLGEPTLATLILQAAAHEGGWTHVPLSPHLPEAAQQRWLETLEISLAATTSGDLAAGATPRLLADPNGERWRPTGRIQNQSPQQDPQALAAILLTSGTTGAPNPIALPRKAIAAHHKSARKRLELGDDDTWLAPLPLNHVGGFMLAQRLIEGEGTLILPPSREAPVLTRLVAEHGVTHASLVPTLMARLLAANDEPAAGTLKGILLGGDRAPPELVTRALERGYPLHPTYGLTEACSQVATATLDDAYDDPAGVGRPLDGVRLSLDTQQASNGAGLITIEGPTLALVMQAARAQPTSAIHTKDMGALDSKGRLHVLGRADDLIISGGENIDPLRVEEALQSHPAIAEACVVGLPDETWGQRVSAAIVYRAGQTASRQQILDFLDSRLERHERPKTIIALVELPKTPNGKIDRGFVRRWVARLQGATKPT
jgi:o-succinylbenzoate---CoA ligase